MVVIPVIYDSFMTTVFMYIQINHINTFPGSLIFRLMFFPFDLVLRLDASTLLNNHSPLKIISEAHVS